ncbi:ribosome-associated translation inhibitor RaiA [Roseospira marina]|uniref:Ribosome-associated translation inhibitor RaiA n=1 Tax=Roseospira marina TaxID=140057 RepID=A0A5M6IGD7_9PROT|nr:HPF/RaiA family ribosome-associated protein [Roseospira marina]KAA5607376.1 ribosome-associated translation inhibitor RaiA [Roseospira marina]MBB4312455.1 ribosome-associated translation inhibitor RaiA [Roseospira marina]MBB5085529.1 ribosome-associated translation inhibitor RaiA [Roseospira marina]
MQIPLQIAFDGLDHSDAVEARVRERVDKLEQYCDRITGCRVVISVHHKNVSSLHRKGEPYHVAITCKVPGEELVVRRDPKEPKAHEDINVALRDAFSTMERRVKDYTARQKVV